MKIRPVRAELFHVDGQADSPDESNYRFFFNFATAPKNLGFGLESIRIITYTKLWDTVWACSEADMGDIHAQRLTQTAYFFLSE